MKKILIASNILLLGIIFFISCNQSKDDSVSNISMPNCTTTFTCNANDPIPGTVDGDIIRQMSEAYNGDLAKSMIGYVRDPSSLSRDALSVCFDIEKIKKLICHMECAVRNAGCDSTKLGIRFYYIKYDPTVSNLTGELRQLVNAQQNKHSLVMVPAYLSKNEWFDFDYSDVKPGCKLKPDTLTHAIKGVINLLDGNNHGGIGPPPEPGTFPTIEN